MKRKVLYTRAEVLSVCVAVTQICAEQVAPSSGCIPPTWHEPSRVLAGWVRNQGKMPSRLLAKAEAIVSARDRDGSKEGQ